MRGESDSYLRGAAKTARDILPPMAGKRHSYLHQHLFYFDKGHYLWHLRLVSPRPPASARAGEGLGGLSDRGGHGRHFRPGTGENRSEERRVGKEGRSRWAPDHLK